MFRLWSYPKNNEQFLLELDEHSFCLWLLPLHYLHTYLHVLDVERSAHAENCKGQGIQPFNEHHQMWLELKWKAGSLGLGCPQHTGGPEAASPLPHGGGGREGRIVSTA